MGMKVKDLKALLDNSNIDLNAEVYINNLDDYVYILEIEDYRVNDDGSISIDCYER